MDVILSRFVAWIRIKVKIHLSEAEPVFFGEGEIWYVHIGANVGHEMEGKNDNFERPILILKKFNKYLLWAVSLSSKIKEDNPYYYQYAFNGEKYSAILSQLRILSSKRLIRKVGMFPVKDYDKIRERIKELI